MKDTIFMYLFSMLQITLIDIVLSGDNVGAIALAVRRLPKKQAKTANIIGVTGAICMRILFASVITTILMIEWLPIKLLGGLLLLKITWNILTLKDYSFQNSTRGNSGLWMAIYNIILADLTMSLDNVLAIGGLARGNIWLIIFGLFINIPIIFFGSQFVVKLINKYRLTIFLGAGILIHTALEMILEDNLVAPYFENIFILVFPWIAALLIVIFCMMDNRILKKV